MAVAAVVIIIIVAVAMAVVMAAAAVMAPGKGSGKNPKKSSLRKKRRFPSGLTMTGLGPAYIISGPWPEFTLLT